MDITFIKTKFQKAVATVSAAALLLSGSGAAFAVTVSQAPSNHWVAPYIQDHEDVGSSLDFLASTDLADSITRGEFAQLVAQTTGMLDFFVEGSASYYTDLAPTHPHFEAIQVLTDNGVMNGDKNAVTGELEGTVRPDDSLNRAEMTQIWVWAAGVPSVSDMVESTGMADLDATPESTWYVPVAEDTWAYGGIEGDDPVSPGAPRMFNAERDLNVAEAIKVSATLLTAELRPELVDGGTTTPPPVDECDDPDTEEVEECPAPAGDGTLEITVNQSAMLAPNALVPLLATNVNVFAVDLTATGDDVVLESMELARTGLGYASDIREMALFVDNVRVGGYRSFKVADNTANFTNLKVTVPAGETVTLVAHASIAEDATFGSQHSIVLTGADKVVGNYQQLIVDAPVSGNPFVINNTKVSDVTLYAETISSITMGEVEELSAFSARAGVNHVAFKAITFTQEGTVDLDDLEDLVLKIDGVEVASNPVIDRDRMGFVIEEGYHTIPKGKQVEFTVEGVVNLEARLGDTLQIVSEKGDAIFLDQQLAMFGANVINDCASHPNAFLPESAECTGGVPATPVEGTPVVIMDNKLVSQTVHDSIEDLVLVDIDMAANADVQVKKTRVAVKVVGPNGNTPSYTAGVNETVTAVDALGNNLYGVTTVATGNLNILDDDFLGFVSGGATYYCRAQDTSDANWSDNVGDNLVIACDENIDGLTGNLTEVDIRSFIEDIALENLETGTQYDYRSNLNHANFALGADGYAATFNQSFDLNAGEILNLGLVVSLSNSNEMVTGYVLSGLIDFTVTGAMEYYSNGSVLTSDDITNGVVYGPNFFINAEGLTFVMENPPVSNDHVDGVNLDLFATNVTNNSSIPVKFDGLTFRLYADDAQNGFTAGVGGDVNVKNVATTCSLYRDGVLVKAGQSIDLVNLDGVAGYNAGVDYHRCVFKFNDAEEIEDGESATYTLQVDTTGNSTDPYYLYASMIPSMDVNRAKAGSSDVGVSPNTHLNPLTLGVPAVVATMNTGGTFNIYAEGNLSARQIVSGTLDQELARYRAVAINEAMEIDDLVAVFTSHATNFDQANAVNISGAIQNLEVVVTLEDGTQIMDTASVANGVANFTNVGAVIPANEEATVLFRGDVPSIASFPLRDGQNIRFGLSTNAAHRLVGQSSGDVITNLTINSPANIRQHQIVGNKVTFADGTNATELINNSTNVLKQVRVTKQGPGTPAIARLVYRVTVTGMGAGNMTDADFLVDGAILQDDQVNIWFSDGAGPAGDSINLATGDADALDGVAGGGVPNATYYIVVTFTNGLDISDETTLALRAYVTGASDAAGSAITTRVEHDQNQITGLVNSGHNPNRGYIYNTVAGAVATTSLFVEAQNFVQDFIADRNLVVTSKAHNPSGGYSWFTLAGSNVVDASGTNDFRNGYLQPDISALPLTTLTSEN